MKLKLDEGRLRELLSDFYSLTGIRITIFDAEFCELMSYPDEPCAFCARVRRDPDALRRCLESDRAACRECAADGKLRIYKCHASLAEAAAPVRVDGMLLGFVMMGQTASADADPRTAEREMLAGCEGCGVPANELVALYRALTVKTDAQIRAAARIMETCASYLWIERLVSVDGGSLVYRVMNFISCNLTRPMQVDTLCAEFGVSRARLYALFGEYFGVGVAEYIREKRVRRACELLAAGQRVGEAAEHSGFTDYNYFSKIFRRSVGLSPSEYRKNALLGNNVQKNVTNE